MNCGVDRVIVLLSVAGLIWLAALDVADRYVQHWKDVACASR